MGYCFVVGFGGSFNHASRADGALTFLCFAKDENLHSLSARLLLPSLNTPTALPSQVNRTTINLACRLVFVFTEYKIRCADNEYRFWQKKGDPDVQVWLRQTSRRLHPFFGACELAALCASSDKRTLVPEKRMLRSAERRGGGGSIKRMRWD